MNKIRNLVFLAAISVFSLSVQAGSGAGGEIYVQNDSEDVIRVTWSGAGCGAAIAFMTLVCEDMTLNPGEGYHYKYNWGVTKTWLNISIVIEGSNPKINSCASLYVKDNPLCIVSHKTISTDAWKTDICTFSGKWNEYATRCVR